MVDVNARERRRKAGQGGGAEQLASAQQQLRTGKRHDQLAPAEQAALLRQRLERQELEQADLEHAARTGHAGAALALGQEPQAPSPDGLPGWLAESQQGRVQRSIVLALTRVAAQDLRTSFPPPDADEAEQESEALVLALLDAVESWALAGEGSLSEAVAHPVGRLEQVYEQLDETGYLEVWSRQEHSCWELLDEILGDDVQLARLDLYLDPQAIQRELLRSATQQLWRIVKPKPRQGPQPYAPKQRYTLGEQIQHPKFGLGTVTRALPRQIEVSFASGAKKLAHNM